MKGYCLILLGFFVAHLSHAQVATRLTVVEKVNGVERNRVEVVVAPPETVDEVLKKYGYDDESIAKLPSDANRHISITTEELEPTPPGATLRTEGRTETIGGPTVAGSTRTRTVTRESGRSMELKDLVDIPPGAKVEQLSDGSQRVITYNADGSVAKTATVRVHQAEQPPTADQWFEEPISIPASTVVLSADSQGHNSQVTYSANGNFPILTVTTAAPDPFDYATLKTKAKDLETAPVLSVSDLKVQPDYESEQLRYSFTAPAGKSLTFTIYDVVGATVFTDTVADFSGSYSRTLPEFNLYKRGNYLLLVSQDGSYYTQTLTLK